MDATRTITLVAAVLYLLFCLAVVGAAIYLFVLVVKALKKYINSKEVREEKKAVAKSLGEVLKENRLRCKMTQEFVAETLGVSRQSVSKWENGSSDPNTSNLIALAKLYKVSPEELLQNVKNVTSGEGDQQTQVPKV
ncbi:MAG: helix-turn-helix transcriptional regulator [Peptococcaceae bacterium]|nr:helix-turn-helix transcriptional regulator [Peptococcaceae bacterium]